MFTSLVSRPSKLLLSIQDSGLGGCTESPKLLLSIQEDAQSHQHFYSASRRTHRATNASTQHPGGRTEPPKLLLSIQDSGGHTEPPKLLLSIQEDTQSHQSFYSASRRTHRATKASTQHPGGRTESPKLLLGIQEEAQSHQSFYSASRRTHRATKASTQHPGCKEPSKLLVRSQWHLSRANPLRFSFRLYESCETNLGRKAWVQG